MEGPRDIPSARAVGGADGSPGEGRRRWLTRTAVEFDQPAGIALAHQCVCCRDRVDPSGGSRYCRRCRRHQRVYRIGVAAAFVVLGWVGLQARGFAFDLAPFAGTWTHVGLTFAIALAGPAVLVLALNALRSEPVHGHWGHAAVHSPLEGGAGTRSRYRNAGYGEALAEQLDLDDEVYEVREPRTGWTVVAVFLALLPAASAGYAYLGYDDRRFTLYVDNGTDQELRVAVEGGDELVTVPALRHAKVSLPRTAMTLVAVDDHGAELERLSVGGLDEILAGRYPETLYPDVEHDAGDVFVWNMLRRRCYKASTHTYGTLALGGDSKIHREKAFVSEAEEPFEHAPAVVESSLPMDIREELLRHPCQ